MSLNVIPDGEKIAMAHLRDHDAIQAICGRRVVVKTPSSTAEPWVRATQLDARNNSSARHEHLITFLIQFDCYAGAEGGRPQAVELGQTARAVLHQMPEETFDEVVVSAVGFTSHIRLPDGDFEPARERVILTAELVLHPA